MIRPLDYHSGLSLKDAEARLDEIKTEFERVKTNYSGLIGRFRKNMGNKDQTTLGECIGVLLPLSLEDSVQKQMGEMIEYKDTVHNRIMQLNRDISLYLANFKNTGVSVLRGPVEDFL